MNYANPIQLGEESAYTKGKQAIENGDWQEGITIWIQASNLSTEEETDPRIGSGFIEFVTTEKLRKFYKYVTPLYYKSLSRASIGEFKDHYLLELEKTQPLLDEKDYRSWKKLIENNDIRGLQNLLKFWIQQDITISDNYNEKLIEHWERIDFIKRTFTKNKTTVFNTDERGLIYLKHGNPDLTRRGVLQFNQLQAEGWAQTILINNYSESVQLNDSSFQTRGSIGAVAGSFGLAKNLAYLARQYFDYPEYEIWVYKNDRNYKNLVYIFGQNGKTGDFSIIHTIDDFIPTAAFKKNYISDTQYPVPPATLLQMAYYSQLTTVDNYFAQTYIDLQQHVLSNTNIRQSNLAYRYKNIHKSRMNTLSALNPSQGSEYDALNTLNLNTSRYRILDENNENKVITYLYTNPQSEIIVSLLSGAIDINDLLLTYTVQQRDNDWNLLYHDSRETRLDNTLLNNIADQYVTAAFLVPGMNGASSIYGVELKALNQSGNDSSQNSQSLKAYSKTTGESLELLNTDRGQLETSDLILGYSEYESGGTEDDIIFMLTPDNIIPINKDLYLRFEVYHLKLENTSANFSMNYRIIKNERVGLLKKIFNRNEELKSITANLSSNSSTYRNDIQIVTDNLEPGEYILETVITDLNSGQSIKRKIKFEISEFSNF
ncbi:MAG: GWxTD domain-containing protein [Gracilimonas sp.]